MSNEDRLEVWGERVGGAGNGISGGLRDWRRRVGREEKTEAEFGTGGKAIEELGIRLELVRQWTVEIGERGASKRSNSPGIHQAEE